MEKYAEVHCSTVASLLADYKIGRKKQKERGEESEKEREREAPVLSSYSHLVSQERLTPNTTGHRVLRSVASLLLTLHLCPAVLWGGGRMGRDEIRRHGQGFGHPFTVIQ